MDISPKLKEAADQLSSNIKVPIGVQTVRRKSFDGSEMIVCVISVILGGLGKGVLSSIGSDLWKGLKTLLQRTNSQMQLRVVTTLVVDYDSATGQVRYSCQIDQEGDVDRFAASVTAAIGGERPLPNEDTQYRVELALQPNDEWKELPPRPGMRRK